MKPQTSIIGQYGEELVVIYLREQKFNVLERNYRQRYGEIDIIAINHELLVFVEVKMRRTCRFDFSCVVTSTKQKKIAAVARHYLTRHTHDNRAYRFDIALVEGAYTQERIIYIPQAFIIDSW